MKEGIKAILERDAKKEEAHKARHAAGKGVDGDDDDHDDSEDEDENESGAGTAHDLKTEAEIEKSIMPSLANFLEKFDNELFKAYQAINP